MMHHRTSPRSPFMYRIAYTHIHPRGITLNPWTKFRLASMVVVEMSTKNIITWYFVLNAAFHMVETLLSI